MKNYLICIGLLFCSGIIYCQSSTPPTTADFKKLGWLEGTWNRTDIKPGHSGHERWARVSDTEWEGLGVTMKGNDTAFVEKLKLVIKDNAIYYVSDIPENKGPVDFTITAISDTGFVCENPGHDFPKKIAYQNEGNKIKATISGDGKSIDYLFEKAK